MSSNGDPQQGHAASTEQGVAAPAEDGGTLRILQLTDTHLFRGPNGRLLGQNTRHTLDLVIERARASFWPVDRVLLTGDLVHDESPEGYTHLSNLVARLDTPCNALPGNHDTASAIETLDGDIISTAGSVRCGSWNLIFLDSTIPEEEGGHLDQAQLEHLAEALASNPDAHALVCLHHQPVPVGSDWMDTMALDNPREFFAIIDSNPQVRGIIWGHIHQEFNMTRNGVSLFGTPSTCIQFLPASENFAVDALTPGFRWLELHPAGRIRSGIERIAGYPDPVDLATGGY